MEAYFATAGEYYHHQQQQQPDLSTTGTNHFTVDDLLVDFPTDDDVIINDAFFQPYPSNSAENSSVSGSEAQLSSNFTSFSGGDLCVPYDDLAELEWLSSFTEESFSSDDLHNLQIISAANKTPATDTSSSNTTEFPPKTLPHNRVNSPIFQNNILVPGKIRSKRSRAAPGDWSSRLILLKPSASNDVISENPNLNPVRRCLHCGSDKTPQWRRGPMGPKTLCNACGVRFKSGRLVPEYRPAASPTFVPAKHSNSHRKVMELRRQMELRNSHRVFLDSGAGDEYLIHDRIGSGFIHMI